MSKCTIIACLLIAHLATIRTLYGLEIPARSTYSTPKDSPTVVQ